MEEGLKRETGKREGQIGWRTLVALASMAGDSASAQQGHAWEI